MLSTSYLFEGFGDGTIMGTTNIYLGSDKNDSSNIIMLLNFSKVFTTRKDPTKPSFGLSFKASDLKKLISKIGNTIPVEHRELTMFAHTNRFVKKEEGTVFAELLIKGLTTKHEYLLSKFRGLKSIPRNVELKLNFDVKSLDATLTRIE